MRAGFSRYAAALAPILLAGGAAGATAPTSAAAAGMASTYDVSSADGVHVVYTTAAAEPQLTYETADQTLSFHGDEIRTVSGDLGTMVSVTVRRTIDTGSTSFTLIVPRVRIAEGQQEMDVETIGIATRHRFSVVPRFNLGQLDQYGEVTLKGKARR